MRILSWNVNGLRACAKKGFLDWLHNGHGKQGANDASHTATDTIVGVQEVRAQTHQLSSDVCTPKGWHTHFFPAQRPGYSGVGLYSRRAPDAVACSLETEEFDIEGRLQIARFGKLWVANVYFPNGNGKNRDNSRIPFKLGFYRRLFDQLEPFKAKGERILVMGDFNTAHQEIDLARPKQNVETSGFRPEERAELNRWLTCGWVDTFRHFEPAPGHYTWWSQRRGVRERNVGWRIDYVLASPAAMPYVHHAFIHPDTYGSDHCPIGVDVSPDILA